MKKSTKALYSSGTSESLHFILLPNLVLQLAKMLLPVLCRSTVRVKRSDKFGSRGACLSLAETKLQFFQRHRTTYEYICVCGGGMRLRRTLRPCTSPTDAVSFNDDAASTAVHDARRVLCDPVLYRITARGMWSGRETFLMRRGKLR